MNKQKAMRLIVDSMLIVLLFGLLLTPISFIGLSGYKGTNDGMILGASTVPNQVPVGVVQDVSVKSVPSRRSFVVRVVEMNKSIESTESTASVNSYDDSLEMEYVSDDVARDDVSLETESATE